MIGQVVAGTPLLEEVLPTAELVPVALCADNNTVLQGVCENLGIEVALYPEVLTDPNEEVVESSPVDGSCVPKVVALGRGVSSGVRVIPLT